MSPPSRSQQTRADAAASVQPGDDARTHAFAAVTLQAVKVIRDTFPVRGRSWQRAGDDEQTAMRPFLATVKRLASCWWVWDDKGGHSLGPLPANYFGARRAPDDKGNNALDFDHHLDSDRYCSPAVLEVVAAWETLLRHYGWGWPYPNGKLDTRRRPWDWPGVPVLDPVVLEKLERAARTLLSSTSLREVQGGKQRPCYERDHTWLSWNEEGLTPSQIRDRWNEEHPEEAIGKGKSGREVVKTALKKARGEKEKS